MHLSYLMGETSIKEDALGRSGFPGVNMCYDADISIPVDGRFSGHGNLSMR
jgi:hypothetical protein